MDGIAWSLKMKTDSAYANNLMAKLFMHSGYKESCGVAATDEPDVRLRKGKK
jgi:hypothetical protein